MVRCARSEDLWSFELLYDRSFELLVVRCARSKFHVINHIINHFIEVRMVDVFLLGAMWDAYPFI